jgi:hypothetical protein
MQPEAALQTAQVDAARGVEIDFDFRHLHCSQSRRFIHRNGRENDICGRKNTWRNIPRRAVDVHPQPQMRKRLTSCRRMLLERGGPSWLAGASDTRPRSLVLQPTPLYTALYAPRSTPCAHSS